MEVEEEVRIGKWWVPRAGAHPPASVSLPLPQVSLVCCAPNPQLLVPVFSLLCVATLHICSLSLYPAFLFSHLSPSGPVHFTRGPQPLGCWPVLVCGLVLAC